MAWNHGTECSTSFKPFERPGQGTVASQRRSFRMLSLRKRRQGFFPIVRSAVAVLIVRKTEKARDPRNGTGGLRGHLRTTHAQERDMRRG